MLLKNMIIVLSAGVKILERNKNDLVQKLHA